MEWQPIETAPIGVLVLLGWWDFYNNSGAWQQRSGIAWAPVFLGLGRKRGIYREATHWMPLPNPPTE